MEKLKTMFRDARAELKKITWPGRQQVWYSTLVVIFVTLIDDLAAIVWPV